MDKRFFNTIKNNKESINNYTKSTQFTFSDWVLSPVRFEYTSSTRITAIEGDPSDFFVVGDPIRYKQGAGFKYGYVFGVSSTYLDITGGSDFSVANSAITEVSRGVVPNPTGFPYVFNFDPDFRTPVVNQLSGLNNEVYKFWVQGKTCTVNLEFDTADLSSNNSSIVCDLPISADASNGGVPAFSYQAVNNFTPQTGYVKLGSSVSFDAEFQVITDSGFIVWSASTNGVGLDATFTYLI